MLLNSIAIYFLLELDDQLVSFGDYQLIEHYIEKYKKVRGDTDKIEKLGNYYICNECNSHYFTMIGDFSLWICNWMPSLHMLLQCWVPGAAFFVFWCYNDWSLN